MGGSPKHTRHLRRWRWLLAQRMGRHCKPAWFCSLPLHCSTVQGSSGSQYYT